MIRALALVLALAGPAAAQTLAPSPSLAPDVDALPRLAGDSAVARAVNAELAKLDAKDLDAVNCYGGSRPEGPFRSVDILSDGPEFLSFFITTGASCDGAAHPWSAQEIVSFDLETGQRTDLISLLPDVYRPAGDQSVLLSVLFLNNLEDLPGNCALAYAYALREGYLSFDLGLAEARGALMLWPQGLAYIDTSCLEAAYVPVEQLHEAGFGGRPLQALTP